jgi:hypothetical protein
MRYDGEPVRLGMRTTRRMLRASQPDKQNGTLSVHTIKASGHMHRSNRPNTRLHPTTTPYHQINPCNAGAIHTGHSRRASIRRNQGQNAACAANRRTEIVALSPRKLTSVAGKVPICLNAQNTILWGPGCLRKTKGQLPALSVKAPHRVRHRDHFNSFSQSFSRDDLEE